jgi:hypothetical protein
MTNRACDAVVMPVTPHDVIQRLMEVYDVSTPADLAEKTGLELRTLQRWNSRKPMPEVQGILTLVEMAGMLVDTSDGVSARTRLERARRTAVRLANDAEELARLLGAPLDEGGSR